MRKALAAFVCVILAVGIVGCGGGGGGGGGDGSVVTVPADPTGLTTLVLSSSQIDLTWTDNASNEESYKIERGTDGTTFAEIASVSAGVVTYSDTGLLDSTVYYYRVRAYNSAGYSGYTAVASGITSPAKSAFSGVVYEQTSDNGIVPAGGTDIVIEVFSAKPSKVTGPGSGILGPPLSTTTARTTSNGRYSISSVDVPRGSTVRVSIAGSETPQSQETFTTATADEKASAIQKKRGRTKQTIRASVASSVNTLSDTTLPRCEILVPAGAVSGDVTDVVLTPYHRAEILPVRLPDNYAMLAAGDCYSSSTVTFASGIGADVYVILPSSVRAEELSSADIRLMELINGSWVIATGKGKAYTTGTRYGHVGPHDTDTPARLGGVRPWCWAIVMPSTANISGTVRNASGAAVAGAFVFGGGSKTHTASDGTYTLKNVAAVKTNMLVSVTVTADGYDGASQFAGVSPGQTTTGVNFTLQTSSQTAELSGKVTNSTTSATISGSTVTLRTDAGIRSMKYDNKNTSTDLTDDTFYVTPPVGVTISTYVWKLTTPAGATFASTQATGSSVIINQLATEAGNAGNTLGIGAYKVELEMTLAGGKKVAVAGGFLYKKVGLQTYISDVTLPLTFDDQLKLTGVTDANGAYRISNVPTGETFYAQATASGYTNSTSVTLAVFTAGEIRTQDFALSAASTDATAPSVPTGLKAIVVNSGQIFLDWSPSSDNIAVKGYDIYRDGTKIASVTALSYSDTGLSPSTTYTYTVAATDAAGNASAQSGSASATTTGIDMTAPSVPLGLAATAIGPTQVNLSWSPSSDNIGVAGYNVYRGGVLVSTITTTSFSDNGLSAATTYAYEIAAGDASGNVSAKCPAVTVTTPAAADTQAPSVPAGLTATAISSGQINLAWSASTDNTAVTGYKVYRNSVYLTSVTGTSHGDSGLTASTTYSYTVAAYDAAGNTSAQSGSVSAMTNAAGDAGPIAWWKFDETSGTTAADSSGNGNNGTVYGATWSGGALSFDGTDDYVVVSPNVLNNLSIGTVQAYIYTYTNPNLNNTNTIIAKGTANLTDFIFGVSSSSNNPGVHIGPSLSLSSNSTVLPQNWTMLSLTWDGSFYKIYINGNLDVQVSSSAVPSNTSNVVKIGKHDHPFGPLYFKGLISDLKIYNYALTATEISNAWTNSWQPTATTGTPSGRTWHTAVWTGTEMIVWGGYDGSAPLNSGAKYNPSTDSWTPTTTTGAPSPRYGHTAVWTGSEMIVWGGRTRDVIFYNDGWRYNPVTDSWTPISTIGAPSGRYVHTAVWTRTEMIVWGGGNTTSISDGGRYNPTTNSWAPVNSTNAPSAREQHTAIWTGTEMIVWGGNNTVVELNSGGRYNPSTDSWTSTTTTGAPIERYEHTAVWTGSEMIVWGGVKPTNGLLNDGGRYNPTTNSWSSMATAGVPTGRYFHTAIWNGTEMIVWGGSNFVTMFNDGGLYNPTTNAWSPTSTAEALTGRRNHVAVWTGSNMLLWGGSNTWNLTDGTYYSDGRILQNGKRFLVSETFSNGSANWELVGTPVPYNTNNSTLSVNVNTSSAGAIIRRFAYPTDGKVTYRFRVKLGNNNRSTGIWVKSGAKSVAYLLFNQVGTVATNGGVAFGAYSANTWYSVVIEHDISTDKTSMLFNGVQITQNAGIYSPNDTHPTWTALNLNSSTFLGIKYDYPDYNGAIIELDDIVIER